MQFDIVISHSKAHFSKSCGVNLPGGYVAEVVSGLPAGCEFLYSECLATGPEALADLETLAKRRFPGEVLHFNIV